MAAAGIYPYIMLTVIFAAGCYVGWQWRGFWARHGSTRVRVEDATGKPRSFIKKG